MKKIATLTLLWIFVLTGLVVQAQEVAAKKEIKLTLEDSIVEALKNNLSLAVEVLSPQIAQANLSLAREMFIPQMAIDFSNDHQETPSTWWLQGSGVTNSNNLSYGLSLSERIPTGGTLSLSILNYRAKTSQRFQLFNPYYQSRLNFVFTQPLLQGFGPKIAAKEIFIAKINASISEEQLRKVAIDTVYRVEEAYWNLVYSIENLKVRRQSLELARELLTKTKKEVEVGQTAPIELLNAEATVAQREADILQAEALVKSNSDLLRALLNIQADSPGQFISVVPVEAPVFKPISVSYEEVLARALQKRPELEVVRSTIETKKINFSVAKNKLLPNLDLRFSYTSPGISGDKLLYQDDNPFTGVIIGVEKGSPMDGLRDAMKFLYNNWSLSLNLNLPFASMFSKANYTAAQLDLEKTFRELKVQQQQIMLEVSEAVRNLETDAKRVEAYRVARELAEKRLEAETKKLSVGLTTNYFVLEYQEKLANARSAELKAMVDYRVSQARIEKASGDILEKRNISLR